MSKLKLRRIRVAGATALYDWVGLNNKQWSACKSFAISFCEPPLFEDMLFRLETKSELRYHERKVLNLCNRHGAALVLHQIAEWAEHNANFWNDIESARNVFDPKKGEQN